MASNELSFNQADTEVKDVTWCKQDTIWMLSLYGTAIGAGTLFLPIGAGLSGLLPMLVMLVLSFPLTFYSHRALCRFVLASSSANQDITRVVEEYFGLGAGRILTLLYFFAIYPILLMYSVAITNTTESFIVNQLGMTAPPRVVLSLLLIMGLMAIIRYGQEFIVRAMSFLVLPFILTLMALALYLIPHWNNAMVTQPLGINSGYAHGFWMSMWLVIPVMVFSFNHSPIISSFALSQKASYGPDADQRSTKIMKYSHLLMVVTVMFFVFSCVLSLSPQDLLAAKQQNISILSYLANHFKAPLIAMVAPVIAFIAISKSFLGHYLGAAEGLRGLYKKFSGNQTPSLSASRLQWLVDVFMVLTCWIIASLNPSILGMIEVLGGPVIALLLFLMPMYGIAKVPALKKYRSPIADAFVVTLGLIAISAILYGLF